MKVLVISVSTPKSIEFKDLIRLIANSLCYNTYSKNFKFFHNINLTLF